MIPIVIPPTVIQNAVGIIAAKKAEENRSMINKIEKQLVKEIVRQVKIYNDFKKKYGIKKGIIVCDNCK